VTCSFGFILVKCISFYEKSTFRNAQLSNLLSTPTTHFAILLIKNSRFYELNHLRQTDSAPFLCFKIFPYTSETEE